MGEECFLIRRDREYTRLWRNAGCPCQKMILAIKLKTEERVKMYKKRFGKNLGILLDIRGITKEKAAELFGVSSVMVTKYCQGRNFPEGELLCRISVILGVSIDALVGLKPLKIIEEGNEHLKKILQ